MLIQKNFEKIYFKGLYMKVAPYGIGFEEFLNAMNKGIYDMVVNDGKNTNEYVFWNSFKNSLGEEILKLKPIIDDFYLDGYENALSACKEKPFVAETILKFQKMGIKMLIATNPLFLKIGAVKRAKIAGFDLDLMEEITSYEFCSYSKPNPMYYEELVKRHNIDKSKCLVVGNNIEEDMVARKAGLDVFLLNDDIINPNNQDYSELPQGSILDLFNYVK